MKFNQHPEQKAIEAKMHELFEKYVPMSGAAETVGGEIVRAMNRIGYRFYNDGDKAREGYGRETVNPACRYLVKGQHLKLNIWEHWYSDEEYNYQMYEDFKHILEHLEAHPELFETHNDEDMWEYLDDKEDVCTYDMEEDDWYDDDDWPDDDEDPLNTDEPEWDN